jgi:imidazolonepropionase-like amidohydrolase
MHTRDDDRGETFWRCALGSTSGEGTRDVLASRPPFSRPVHRCPVRFRPFSTLVLAAAILLSAEAAAQETFAITGVTVISMADSLATPGRTVIVTDGRIARIGPANATPVPRGARVVDGAGKYLIPGLIEMHTHTSKTRASAFGLFVAHGVTTVRDQGSEHAEVVRWRTEIRAETRLGPRLILAGPYLESLRNIERMRRDPPESRVEPFERARIPVATPTDAHRIVDSLAALGVDHLKVRTVQDRATYLALGAAAAAHGLRLTGHVVTNSPADFLAAGQDGVDHPFLLPPDSLAGERGAALWRELARRDVGVVPTLVVLRESVLRPQAYFDSLVTDYPDDAAAAAVHPLRPYLSRFLVLDWREQASEQTPARRAAFEGFWPMVVDQVKQMRAAGVRIMAGTDVAVINMWPGSSLHDELRYFVDFVGMSPAEALASATRVPAEWLGLADSIGTVTEGKVADLVLLDANPLVDIGNTRRIAAVLLRGRLLDRDALMRLMAEVRAMPDIRANDWRR